MDANDTGDVQRGDRALKILQDRALIKQILGPTVGELKKMATVGEYKKYVEGQPSR
jgi:hypothetical protein